MQLSTAHWHLNFDDFEIRDVVRMAQHGSALAARHLREDFRPWRRRLVAGLTRGKLPPCADVDDADQIAAMAQEEAMAEFDCGQAERAGGCKFKSRLYMTVHARVISWLRHLWTLERGVDHRASAQKAADEMPDPAQADPADLLERGDQVACVQAAVARLAPRNRQLVAMYQADKTWKEIAAALETTPGKAKHRFRWICDRLARWLSE
jgi:DNA-directed RNA polymerase specialized sigma24 family protein